MGFLSGLTEEDLKAPEKLVFANDEIVKFVCIDHRENQQDGSLQLKVNVMTGPHSGKQTSIYLSAKDNATSKKAKAQFLTAGFWTKEELLSGSAPLARLIGRAFSARSYVSEKEGKTYQNWQNFQDLGPHQADAQSAPPQAAAAQAAPAPAAQASSAPSNLSF